MRSEESEDEGVDMEEGGESEEEVEDDEEVEVDGDEKKTPLALESSASLLKYTTPENSPETLSPTFQ